MRAATTTARGPRSRATRRPPGRLDSHKPWTKPRGPVTPNYTAMFNNWAKDELFSHTALGAEENAHHGTERAGYLSTVAASFLLGFGEESVPAETVGDSVSVFHGSINDATSIARNGLDPGLTPTWVTRDLSAARNAIGPARSAVEPLRDPGVIESRIPSAEFEKLLAPSERPYSGFLGGVPGSSEIVLRTPEQIDVFNRYIVGSAG